MTNTALPTFPRGNDFLDRKGRGGDRGDRYPCHRGREGDRCLVDVPELLREVLRVGADAFVLYRWSPLVEVQVLPSDRELADQLRILTSALGLTFLDMLIVAERSYWSCRNQDDWATP